MFNAHTNVNGSINFTVKMSRERSQRISVVNIGISVKES